jgi:LysM repeat protein
MAGDEPSSAQTARGNATPSGATTTDARTSDAADRPGDFERYALIAALTLVVLCLLVWDRRSGGAGANSAPAPDRTLRVEIGGGTPVPAHAAAPTEAPPRGSRPQAANDAPPAPVPVPAPPPRTYTVKGGDTLYDIAKQELGSSSRAKEIADLNGLADPGKLRVGQILKLPAK